MGVTHTVCRAGAAVSGTRRGAGHAPRYQALVGAPRRPSGYRPREGRRCTSGCGDASGMCIVGGSSPQLAWLGWPPSGNGEHMSLDRPIAEDPYAKLPAVAAFDVKSADVSDGQPLDDAQANAGGDTSPQLSWSDAPEGTKSFVVSCFDPDAPSPSGYWHWTAVDIPGDVTALATGAGADDDSLPGGAFHVRNDTGEFAYSGAAPPEGDHAHRYYFVVHAVGEDSLGVDSDSSAAVVAVTLAMKALGRAVLVGTYQL